MRQEASQNMAASIIAALAAVISAVISAFGAARVAKFQSKAAQQNEEQTRHNESREKEAVLQGRMVAALCELEEVTVMAVEGGKVNGNLEAAQKKAKEAKDEYNRFLRETALKEINNE